MHGNVEIDESLFGRRFKYNRGNSRGFRVWIFGLVERETNYIKLFPVDKHDAATLKSIIREHVAPGSTLHTDAWKAYNLLPQDGYQHRVVEHKWAFAVD
jgi:transposase-like protein